MNRNWNCFFWPYYLYSVCCLIYHILSITAARDVLLRMQKQGHTLSLIDQEQDSDDAEADSSGSTHVLDLITRYEILLLCYVI